MNGRMNEARRYTEALGNKKRTYHPSPTYSSSNPKDVIDDVKYEGEMEPCILDWPSSNDWPGCRSYHGTESIDSYSSTSFFRKECVANDSTTNLSEEAPVKKKFRSNIRRERTVSGALPPIPAKNRKMMSCVWFCAKPHEKFQTTMEYVKTCKWTNYRAWFCSQITEKKGISQLNHARATI